MLTVDIKVESRYKVDRKRIRRAVEKTLGEHGVHSDAEVAVVICGERKMRELHKKYMIGDEELHDVLSFPLEGEKTPDGVLVLGDMIICYPVALREAAERDILVDEEIDLLVIHAMDHLLGVHHD